MSSPSLTVLSYSRLKRGVAVNIRGTSFLFVSDEDMAAMSGKSMPEIAAHLNTMQQLSISGDIFEGCLEMCF